MSLKIFGKNTVIYAIGNIGLRASAFLLIPLYTHYLPIKDYGLLVTLQTSIQIMLIVMSLGMKTGLVRFTKEYEENKLIKNLLGTSTLLNFLGGIIVTIISISFLIPFFRIVLHSKNVHSFIFLACCAAFSQSLSVHIMSYYRARNEALKFMRTGILSAALLFSTTLIMFKTFNMGITGVLLAYIATYTFVFLFLFAEVISKIGLGISIPLIPKLLKFSLPLILSMSGQFVIGATSIYFLSYFVGLEIVAIYSLGYKLTQVLVTTTILPFQLAFQPYVFTNIHDNGIKLNISRLLTYLSLATMLMSIITLLLSRFLLPIIAPPEYSSAFLVIILLIPGMSFVGVYYFSETLLSSLEKTHIIGLSMIICAFIYILLNYMLIPAINWYGAVIAFDTSFFLVSTILLIIAIKKLTISFEWKRLFIIGIIFITLLVLIFLLRNTNNIIFYTVTLLSLSITLTTLYFSPFCTNNERLAVRITKEKIKTTFLAQNT